MKAYISPISKEELARKRADFWGKFLLIKELEQRVMWKYGNFLKKYVVQMSMKKI
jgi:hypothetical protein